MRDRVNIPIDPKLKELFERLKEIHGKTWNEVLEKGVREAIMESNPIEILEYDIKLGDEKQDERRQNLIIARANISVLKEAPKIDPELEKRREELWKKESHWLAKQLLSKDGPNWNRILWNYDFESKKEGEKWFRERMKHDMHDKL